MCCIGVLDLLLLRLRLLPPLSRPEHLACSSAGSLSLLPLQRPRVDLLALTKRAAGETIVRWMLAPCPLKTSHLTRRVVGWSTLSFLNLLRSHRFAQTPIRMGKVVDD